MQDVNQRHAKAVLRSLGTSGQPPKWGARLINSGTEPFLRRLRAEYLEDHCMPFDGIPGGGACKWVEADYGNGKTQFLRCVQETAWDLGYVTAFVELSQDECPLDRSDRVFSAIARSLQAKPDSTADVDLSKGLDTALSQLLDRKFPGVLSGMPDEELISHAAEWVKGLKSVPVESKSISTAAIRFLLGQLEGDEETAQIAQAYLRGDDLPAAERKQIGVYEKLEKSSGFRLLRSLTQLIQHSTLANGVVVLFDEARRTLSLMSTKAKKVACENLLSIINRCNSGELPGTLFLYAVMPEFFTDFATNYPALQQRCGQATRINLNHLKGVKELDLLQEIGEKITELFRIANPDSSLPTDSLSANLKQVCTAAIAVWGGTGTRRLLVRSWIQHLNDLLFSGARVLSQEDADQLVRESSERLDDVEREIVELDGE